MANELYDVVVCGAGMAGIATAYSLSVNYQKRVLVIDAGAPLSLTSDKSTECYRNWWGGPDNAMLSLMNRSITLMEEHAVESDNSFLMRPHGYLFATKNKETWALLGEYAYKSGAYHAKHDEGTYQNHDRKVWRFEEACALSRE